MLINILTLLLPRNSIQPLVINMTSTSQTRCLVMVLLESIVVVQGGHFDHVGRDFYTKHRK